MISTEAPEDLHSTTIRDTAPPALPTAPAEADAFDDDEIEKAIAEIRGAIEKSPNPQIRKT
jgi:protein phosphatase